MDQLYPHGLGMKRQHQLITTPVGPLNLPLICLPKSRLKHNYWVISLWESAVDFSLSSLEEKERIILLQAK